MNTYLHAQGLRRWLPFPPANRPKDLCPSSFSALDQPTHRRLQPKYEAYC